jgi:hypothetical protein
LTSSVCRERMDSNSKFVNNNPTHDFFFFFWLAGRNSAKIFNLLARVFTRGALSRAFEARAGVLSLETTGHSDPLHLPLSLLRDSCRCPACYDSSTHQRRSWLVTTAPASISAVTLHDSHLRIHWADGHESVFKENWLLSWKRERRNNDCSLLNIENQQMMDYTHKKVRKY